MAEKLSERERRFVHAYVGEAAGNASKAAELAGYSPKSAGRIGYRLSKRVHVSTAIQATQQHLSERSGFTAEQVISELAVIARTTFDKVTANDKIKALELLGKAHGMFKDKQGDSRVTVNIGFLGAHHAHIQVVEHTDADIADVTSVESVALTRFVPQG